MRSRAFLGAPDAPVRNPSLKAKFLLISEFIAFQFAAAVILWQTSDSTLGQYSAALPR